MRTERKNKGRKNEKMNFGTEGKCSDWIAIIENVLCDSFTFQKGQ